MPLSGTNEGGALVFIDAANFSEQGTPAKPGVTGVAQIQATAQKLNLGMGLSQFGRVSTPFPLWDGSDRVLVAFTPCQVSRKARRRLVRDADRRREGSPGRRAPRRGHRRRRAAGQRAADVRDLHVRPERADLPDRGGGAARIHEHAPGGDPAAHRAERDLAEQRRRDARGAEPRPARSAQRLRHRRPRPHGRRRAGGLGRASRLHEPDRDDGAERPARHALAGGRPREDEGSRPTRCTAARRPASSVRSGPFRPAAA